MLPALEVQKKPYESSLAPKQTVDGVFCIHLTVDRWIGKQNGQKGIQTSGGADERMAGWIADNRIHRKTT